MVIKTEQFTGPYALDKVLEGAAKLYEAVSTTMGPRGSNVLVRKAGARAFMTHDGVTVAKSVKDTEDAAVDTAIDLMREAAMKLDVTTGDGTTTVTVMAYVLLKEAVELVRNGANPMRVKAAIEALEPAVIKEIESISREIESEQDLINIATVSSGSKLIGEQVGKVMYEAGKDTPVILDISSSNDTTVDLIHGVKIQSGSASTYLLDSGVKNEIPAPRIIVVDAKLREKDDILPLLRVIAGLPEEQRNFLLLAADVAGDALSILTLNRLKGLCNLGVVKVPAMVENVSEYLADAAVATGATLLTRNSGSSIKNPEASHFGRAQKVVVSQTETVIINGDAAASVIEKHRAQLTEYLESATKQEDKDRAKKRLEFLNQNIVTIFVGGRSESDAEEKYYRYEDALGACRSALRKGIVPGGGTVLYSIGVEMDSVNSKFGVNLDGAQPSKAMSVFAAMLKAPLYKVIGNAGIELDESHGKVKPGLGFDVTDDSGLVDLCERGIYDPTESELEAVRTAITIAGLLLTSGAVIVDSIVKEPKDV